MRVMPSHRAPVPEQIASWSRRGCDAPAALTRRHLRPRRHAAAPIQYGPVPPQSSHRPGPKPSNGPCQPKLADRLLDPTTTRQTCGVLWYGPHTATLQLTTGTTLWHTVGLAPLPVRWVLVRNAPGRRPPVALVCTDPTTAAEHMVARYVDRRHIETTSNRSGPTSAWRPSGSGAPEPWAGPSLCTGALQCGGAHRSGLAPQGPANAARGMVCQEDRGPGLL